MRIRLIRRIVRTHLSLGLVVFLLGLGPMPGQAQEPSEPKSTRKTCGSCPEGYATTAVTESKEICKDGDPTLVQCVPLGANMLAVCGSCPEGYREIGKSSVPSRCGSKDGGQLTQCQLEKMELNLPDPTKGGLTCPPDCGSTATPGQGALPPPPKYRPTPEKK
jgi:hypothetical protein